MCLEGFFGGGSSPRQTQQQQTYVTAPSNASVRDVEQKQRKKRSTMYNRRSTMLTGGVDNEKFGKKKTLLGE